MIRPRLVLCNGATLPPHDPRRDGRHVVELRAHGNGHNVNIHLENLPLAFRQHLTPRLEDLLEIASYLYTADCGTHRGGNWSDNDATEPWYRDLHYVFAVRDQGFWSTPQVTELLGEILLFLADDKATFSIQRLSSAPDAQLYFEFDEAKDWPFYGAHRVIMFSGGLDSLAGAVDTAAAGQELVLVSHRPVNTQWKRQRELYEALRHRFPVPSVQVGVCINKDENISREHTQRTRSFLYAALGAIVAASVRAAGVRFFENGVVSLNLPVADEVLRSRASRTTHPHTLNLFQRFFSLVLGRDLVFDNPFLFDTKKDIVSLVARHGGESLIGLTCSCSHQGLFASKTQWHCGVCSQCIDRRVAILAAGLEEHDPDTDYKSDVFTGPRGDDSDKNMGVDYARHAMELAGMGHNEMAVKFNRDLSRAVQGMPRRSEAAKRLLDLHEKHGLTFTAVVEDQLRRHAAAIVKGTLDPTSMLSLVVGQLHRQPLWTRYAERIYELLQTALPLACQKHKPKDEPHLQQICDSVLLPFDERLTREFPYLKWGTGATKPDWSQDRLRLWIELKYVRKREDVRPIEKAIAEDITKYGDNGVRVLYLVYDPYHHILDRARFAEPVIERPNMMIRFIS